MEQIKNESKVKQKMDVPEGTTSNQNVPLENGQEYISKIDPDDEVRKDKHSPFTKRIKKSAWIILAVGIVSMIIYSMGSTNKMVDTSEDAVSALNSHMSTTLAAGTKLLSIDDNYVGGDLTITHNSDDEETTLYVWDYAAEDGDYVQILVNGSALGEPFMITNKPVTFTVPTVGEVQVLGTRDGGGGITYAVYYDMNHTTYFNGVDEGGNNLYTLMKE